jgi:hypothetical protein
VPQTEPTSFTTEELQEMHELFSHAFLAEIDSLSTWQDLNHEARGIAKARIDAVTRLYNAFILNFNKTGVATGKILAVGTELLRVRNSLDEDQRGISVWELGRRNF